jgi:hypothetical protein
MSSFNYPTDSQIIDGIVKCVEDLRTASPSPPLPSPPTVEQLKQLLNCSFAASLETEEGRIIAFTISFFGSREHPFPFRMKQMLPLSSRDLTRLAVALDPSRSRICVVPENSTLQIAGLIHLGEQHPPHGLRQGLSELSIRVLGPGILLVRYDEHLILTYRRGRFAFHWGSLARFSTYDAWSALSFRDPVGREGKASMDDLQFRAALVRIARTMLSLRHGGTLLILPDGTNWEDKVPSKRRYAPSAPVTVVRDAGTRHPEDPPRCNNVLRQVMQGPPEGMSILSDDLSPERLISELEWIGRLTATDGMTIILPDSTLLGFGVFFDTHESANDITRVVVIDPYDDGTDQEPKAVESIGGARHQSAAVTCRRFPGAVAVVASQDGSLSSMKWDATKGVVVTNRYLELLLDL